MTQQPLRIASRRSRLALWQANAIKQQLHCHTDRSIEIITFMTQGDRLLDQPLTKFGGKGLFVKELEHALLENRADIAVHSSKDLPAEFPKGLCLGAIYQRGDPRDVFVSQRFNHINELPLNASIGTSSLRRQCQIAHHYPKLHFCNIRGNVETRLRKMDNGVVDAIILAAAGLQRLDLAHRITHYFSVTECLPAVGQGTLAVECRENDKNTLTLLTALHDPLSATCLHAERAFNQALGGNCHVPVAGYATLSTDQTTLTLRGLVGTSDGHTLLHQQITGDANTPDILGTTLAEQLKQQGAQAIINAC